MSVLAILLLVSISIAGSFLLAYLWSVRDGQFDDDYAPAQRILFPDGRAEKKEVVSKTSSENVTR